MKISKLFHWLYGCLMLLPIFAFGVTGLYYALNEHAIQSETIEENYYKNASSLPSHFDGVEEDTLYGAILNNYLANDQKIYFEYIEIISYTTVFDISEYTEEGINYLNYDGEYWINVNGLEYEFGDDSNFSFIFVIDYDWTNLNNFTDFESNFTLFNTNILVPNGENYTHTNSVSTSVINAWNDTWHNSLFSWSGDSFLKPPLDYVCSIFGVGSENTFSYALSYWCSISIIWLIFDVLMYVPLLTHRWLDKGVVE